MDAEMLIDLVALAERVVDNDKEPVILIDCPWGFLNKNPANKRTHKNPLIFIMCSYILIIYINHLLG